MYKHILLLILPIFVSAQQQVEGIITEQINKQSQPVSGANVYWLKTTIGTVTDIDGKFTLQQPQDVNQLIISYTGYQTDTITVNSNYIKHQLIASNNLDELTISTRKQSTFKSYSESANVFTIDSKELLKAACCNLSESFETNPSIDVNFTDAISGTKQIKMLGLTTPYILIGLENIPAVRGAAQPYGLSFIPGTWVESIQVTKGAGSVVNGFESIAGQINAELQKPATDDRLFVNAYAGSNQRYELNTHINTKVTDRWDTGLYIHGNIQDQKHDVNNDGFLDMPRYQQINILNRWQYTNPQKGLVSFINLRYLNDSKQAGQVQFNPDTDRLTTNAWGSEINTQRFEISNKIGYVNTNVPWQSIGLQSAYSYHQQESYYGLRIYDITHHSFYSNLIYNSIISDSRHKIKTGLNFTYDAYDEQVEQQDYHRIENAIGAFFEYNFDNLEQLNLTAGLRIDQHNRLGFFITPRLHVKYSPWPKSAWRASIGRGKRSANIFAENQQLFASSRAINIRNTNGKIYGLDPEIAWNYGVSFLQGFNLFNREADVSIDYYRTDFNNQVVVDWENPFEINFYNLQGDSYANSMQLEFNLRPLNRLDVRTAYKFYDVKTDYLTGTNQKPLIPKHRVFINLGYETASNDRGAQWKFDTTFNWIGKQRFPSTDLSAAPFQLGKYTPTVTTLNAQISRVFSDKFELYAGGENITNYRQQQAIISPDNPFGSNFDANYVYGPIFGSMYYAGLRYKIK